MYDFEIVKLISLGRGNCGVCRYLLRSKPFYEGKYVLDTSGKVWMNMDLDLTQEQSWGYSREVVTLDLMFG